MLSKFQRLYFLSWMSLVVFLILIFFTWKVVTNDSIAEQNFITLMMGTLASVSLFLLLYSIGTSRSKAIAIADIMTAQLKKNQDILLMRDRAINSTAEGIVITDAAYSENPIIYVNFGFERLTGYEMKEVVGKNCRFLQGNDNDQSSLAELEDAIKRRVECKVILRNYRKDGTLFWNKLSIAPVFDEKGRLTNFIWIMHDITEIKKKEEELKFGKEELERIKAATFNIMEDIETTNRELVGAQDELKHNVSELRKLDYQKDQFISIAAHELKTPLTSIKGFADLLRKQEVITNEALREKYLTIIHNDTKRLSTLITNILELSRMDLGTMKLAFQHVNVNDLISEVRDQMDIIIKSKGLGSEYLVEDNLPILWIDKDKTIQVISNLINNAVHYTETGKIKIEVKKKGDLAQFSVTDTGIGIPKEHWPKLFTRFYQVDNPLTRKIGGSGLGLSISKGFVESMGGKIWFDSEVGHGTTFYFSIPLKKTDTKEEVNIVKVSNPN